MDFQNTNLQGGSLQISTEVIGKIARCAALEIDGVAEVSCGKQNKKLKDLLEASSIQSPVTVEMRDGTASITLNLMVSFGARIPAVAEKVQENVKTADQCYGEPGQSGYCRSGRCCSSAGIKQNQTGKTDPLCRFRQRGFVLREEHYGKYFAP